jgi:hypothetical protein
MWQEQINRADMNAQIAAGADVRDDRDRIHDGLIADCLDGLHRLAPLM